MGFLPLCHPHSWLLPSYRISSTRPHLASYWLTFLFIDHSHHSNHHFLDLQTPLDPPPPPPRCPLHWLLSPFSPVDVQSSHWSITSGREGCKRRSDHGNSLFNTPLTSFLSLDSLPETSTHFLPSVSLPLDLQQLNLHQPSHWKMHAGWDGCKQKMSMAVEKCFEKYSYLFAHRAHHWSSSQTTTT